MTAGKSKRVPKGKKSGKKTDPYAKKEWYEVKAPAPFKETSFTKTPINKSAGTRLAPDMLKGRIFEVSVGDLNQDPELHFMIMKLKVEEVRAKNAYTTFAGLRFTADKVRSLVKKWTTLLEASVDVKTTDGYLLRLSAISFTKKRKLQSRKTTYAQSSQVARIVGRMKDIMNKAGSKLDIKELTNRLTNTKTGLAADVQKACSSIYPLENTFIHKVKVLKTPKMDLAKLTALHPDITSVPVASDVGQETA